MILWVDGTPVSQGSLTAVPTARDWRTRPGVRWTLKDAKASLKPWRKKVADAAAEEMTGKSPLEGPVKVRLRFVFERPLSHYFNRKDGLVLRPDAPHWVTSHQLGDLDKHVRAILDSLTGVVFGDDSQVSSESSEKVYGVNPGVMVEVTSIDVRSNR